MFPTWMTYTNNVNDVGVYDTATNGFSSIALEGKPCREHHSCSWGRFSFSSAVSLDGKIYTMPAHDGTLGILELSSTYADTFSTTAITISAVHTGANKYSAAIHVYDRLSLIHI